MLNVTPCQLKEGQIKNSVMLWFFCKGKTDCTYALSCTLDCIL